jgi:hypothetical protein
MTRLVIFTLSLMLSACASNEYVHREYAGQDLKQALYECKAALAAQGLKKPIWQVKGLKYDREMRECMESKGYHNE